MSKFLQAMHDPIPDDKLGIFAGKPGWCIISISINQESVDNWYSQIERMQSAGLTCILRLNHGYPRDYGTIPVPGKYNEFATACREWLNDLPLVRRVIIGNEPNYELEWPQRQMIAPELYAECFNLVQSRLPGYEVITAAVAPWNVNVGDWLDYQYRILELTEPGGIAIHTYSRGHTIDAIHSEEKMRSHPDRYASFKAYRDLMGAIPPERQHLPVYLTETNPNEEWADENRGWIQTAVKEIDWWNRQPGNQRIHCVATYRYQKHDDKWMEGKSNLLRDFRLAADFGFPSFIGDLRPNPEPQPDPDPEPDPPPSREPEPDNDRIWDPRLDEVGVELQEADVEPGRGYWRAQEVYWLNREESGDNPLIWVDVRKDGQRVIGELVIFGWPGEAVGQRTEAKPGEDYATAMLMGSAGNVYTVRVADAPSDKIVGMGLGTPEQPHHTIHTGMRIVYVWTIAPEAHSDDEPHRVYLPSIQSGAAQGESGANGSGQPEEEPMEQYEQWFKEYGELYDIPWRLLSALAKHESNYNPNAVSPVGAMGLMQFMPHTWRDVSAALGVSDPWDPEQSIHAAAYYLDWLRERLTGVGRGDWRWVLAAYNWGIGNARSQPWEDVPGETKRYVADILFDAGISLGDPEAPPPDNNGAPLLWPVDPSLPITQHLVGNYDWYTGSSNIGHTGTDVSAPIGTPIRAPAAGVVQMAGEWPGYGNYLRIYHEAFGFHSFFAHLKEVPDLERGDRVQKGQVVAYTGNTGFSTGAHLHVEYRLADPDRSDAGQRHDPNPADAYLGTVANIKGMVDPLLFHAWINEWWGKLAATVREN